MSESERDYHAGLDGLQEDMANHQRRFSGEVTTRANHELAVETIERLEKQDADAGPVTMPTPASAPTHDVQRKSVNGREYTLEKAPDKTPMYRTASEFEHQVLRHAQPRIDLLMTKQDTGPFGTPSWRTKTLAAMYFKVKSLEAIQSGSAGEADVYERAFQQDLSDLLEDSNKSFGDWRKDSPKKLIVGA